jgi:hypothetical protein
MGCVFFLPRSEIAVKESMQPYVLKLPPSLLVKVQEAAKTAKHPYWTYKRGITTAAWIRRAIERDLAHKARSSRTEAKGITSRPAEK